ncbi:MAG: GAF domain-containing protein, partial [Anaerolineae bacterium]|nr:GAF domain-containing protein [Anaerolineae bacterium]
MTQDTTLAQKQLELVLALDRVRDTFEDDEDPAAMLNAFIDTLRDWFHAQACGMMLLTADGQDVEWVGGAGMFAPQALILCREAVHLTEWGSLSDPDALGISIVLNGQTLGSLVIARDTPFTAEERTLLDLAESQADSTVIQARTIWKYRQRNRELQAINEIDRLRDFTPEESDLISGFTTLLLEHFQAELCLIILSHVDSGELILRGVIDKNELPASALEAVRTAASRLTQVGSIPTPREIDGFHLLAAPFLVSGERLGAIVVGRNIEHPFAPSEHRLLQAMSDQMDSAIAYSRLNQQLAYRNTELEIIYRIDHIRDQEPDFDTLLYRVLLELCSTIAGEIGYIMLYDEANENPLELKAATVEGVLTQPGYYEVIQQYSRMALDSGTLVYHNRLDSPAHSIVAVPLILHDRIIGVFGVVNSTRTRGFSTEDRRILTAITSQVDTAVFERLEQRRMRNVLSRSVDPKVLEQLLSNADAHILQGERVVLTVLFGELRGSTEWTERTNPEDLVATVNRFLGKMTEVIFKNGGTLDKFVGDEVIGLFGSPLYMDDHAQRAARAALEMQDAHRALQQQIAAEGKELPPMGIGVSSGEV